MMHQENHDDALEGEERETDQSDVPLWAGLSQIVSVDKIPPKGMNVHAEITQDNLENLRQIFDLRECPDLSASFTIKPLSRGRISVKGEIFARVVQSCIVTLEPVEAEIRDTFDVQFWPEEDIIQSVISDEDEGKNKEIQIDPFNEEEPETLENGKLNLGRFLFELFSTTLDPYPRKPDASFTWQGDQTDENTGKIHPFAVLKNLQKKSQDDEA